ncbi:hypothetical protein HY086_04605 [Candidatus Gottesmanbacteria bacterium]|nr:hypothetical protein [Candidatus Gottesmanbacteria bacterium]
MVDKQVNTIIQTNLVVEQFLKGLGLTDQQARGYVALLTQGPLTTLGLSRSLGEPRTSTYRLLESLKEAGVVEEVVEAERMKAQAVSVDRLERMLAAKEEEVKKLRSQLPDVLKIIHGGRNLKQPGTQVLFYRGVSGMKQMIWNVLRAKDFRGYVYQNWNDVVGDRFVEQWSRDFEATGVKARDICSDEYLRNRLTSRFIGNWDNWTRRYVPSSVLTIDHQIDIYNNVVAYYYWEEKEIFGVEIYNERVSRLQKQLHDVLWKMATPMTKVTADSLDVPVKRARFKAK